MIKITNATSDRIDVEEITKAFRVTNIDVLTSYLKEVWRVNKKLTNI